MADVVPSPFPARSKSNSGEVKGIETAVSSISFTDKILVTISQGGRLAHWVHIPLHNPLPDRPPVLVDDDPDLPPSDLLPLAHLTATTVLGGTVPERETAGQLLATQIGSAILSRDANEQRLLVVGLGLQNAKLEVEEYADLVGLVLSVI